MQILIDLPEELEQEVSFTLTGRALEHQIKTAVTAATAAMTDTAETYTAVSARTTLQQQITDLKAQLDAVADLLGIPHGAPPEQALKGLLVIASDRDKLVIQNAALTKERDALKTENAALKAGTPPPVPPVPVAGKPVKPTITKTAIKQVVGLCITLDNAPSAAKDMTAREHIKLAADMGFNTVRFIRNAQEVAEDLKRTATDPRNIVAYAHSLGLAVIFDTVELVVQKINADTPESQAAALKRKTYFNGLHELGGVGIFINDADRTALERDLPSIVTQIRAASDLPLFGSVMASANLPKFDKLMDFTECQTFGSLSEFRSYLALPADVLCIDGQSSATPEYLKGMTANLLASARGNLFVYASLDNSTNWLAMPETVAVYRKFLADFWNAQRQPVAPLTA